MAPTAHDEISVSIGLLVESCIFRSIPATLSDSFLPPVPEQTCHLLESGIL